MAIPASIWFICHNFGQGAEASIFFLVLPDVVELLSRGAQNQTDVSMNLINDTIKIQEQAVVGKISSSWKCIAGKDGRNSMSAQAALFTSSFYFVACQIMLLVACYHLHHTYLSLIELNDLLLVYNQKDAGQAVLMHKLHKIRRSITNKRCLHHFACHAFPARLRPDTTLIWWFQTRAAIFADIKFNLQKRTGVLLICFFPAVVLSVLAVLAAFYSENGFSMICYAFTYGFFSALVLILYFFFGSRVNAELQRGIDILQELYIKGKDDASPRLRRSTSGKESILSEGEGLVSPLAPGSSAEDVCRHFLQYAIRKPYTLKFLCFSLTLGFFSVVATPLATFASALIALVLKHLGFDFLQNMS